MPQHHALAVAAVLSMTSALTAGSAAPAPAGGNLDVTSLSPARHAGNVSRTATVAITFDRAIDPSTVPPAAATIAVLGVGSGPATGTWSLADDDHTIRFTPDEEFIAGEVVRVIMTNDLAGADGVSMRSAGHVTSFRVRASPAIGDFEELTRVSTRDEPDTRVRIYGGQASDFNEDGALDLAIVHEDSSDVRVLLNPADGTGLFTDFLTPVPVGNVPSPNEAADFDGDGHLDMCTVNIAGGSSTVLLGSGDGTLASSGSFDAGLGPHGLAVLDTNGDGAMDIVTANTGDNNLSLLVNHGDGTFANAVDFESGGEGEYGLTAADLNNDGIDDLIVGARSNRKIIVLLGNGDETFTQHAIQESDGAVWMIVAGDVNGDGNMDITAANSGTDTGTILFGDGTGNLAYPVSYPAGDYVIATDLGDVDGDGDLDWVLSAFSSASWAYYENDGTGTFTFRAEFDGPANSACCIIADTDQDHDLDMVLLDEIDDWVILQMNVSHPSDFGDLDANGFVNFADVLVLLAAWGPCPPGDCIADIDDNGVVDFSDLLTILANWS